MRAGTAAVRAPISRLPLYSVLVLLVCQAAWAQLRVEREAETDSPCLLVDPAELEYHKALIEQGHPFKVEALRSLEGRLGIVLAHKPRVPTLEAVRRLPSPYSQGPARDGGVRQYFYGWGSLAADDARDCALAFHFTGRQEYLDKAREILLTYVTVLNPLPQDYADNRQAVHYVCMPVLKLAWAYDLIREYLSEERRAAVEEWLLQAALYLTEHDWETGHQCVVNWYNACVAAIGYVTGRDELVDWAIDRPAAGFKAMVAADIGIDGEMVKERRRHENGELAGLDYGLFNLEALAALAEMAHHHGQDLWHYSAPNGASIVSSVGFYAEYVRHYVGRTVPEPDPYAGETVATHKPPMFELIYLRLGHPGARQVLLRHRGGYDGHLLGNAALAFGVPV